jgi:hypothetical protein
MLDAVHRFKQKMNYNFNNADGYVTLQKYQRLSHCACKYRASKHPGNFPSPLNGLGSAICCDAMWPLCDGPAILIKIPWGLADMPTRLHIGND